MISNSIGPYRLITKLAEGGMAELYLAKSELMGIEKFLVIKKVRSKFSGSADFIQMFINEAKTIMNMNHKNVVSIFDFNIDNGDLYIAMEYVQGVNLSILQKLLTEQHLRGLTLAEKIYIISQVAQGLDYAHNCREISSGKPLGIIHRDVSPDNIMISTDAGVKIIDFGIAINENSLRALKSTFAGKSAYMSPEQARQSGHVTLQTDIFSLGLVFWEMLSGKKMYEGVENKLIIKQAREATYKKIEGDRSIDSGLEKILKKSLDPDLKKRYESMQFFYQDLDKYLNVHKPDFSTNSLKEKILACCKLDIEEIQKIIVHTMNNNKTGASELNALDLTTIQFPEKDRKTFKSKTIKKRRKKIKKVS